MNIKMVVTDLDNTLLKSDKTISDYTAKVLNGYRARGIKIVFATARAESNCEKYIELINPDAIVSNGGALVRIGDETVYRKPMDLETTNALLLSCVEHKSVGCITVETDKGCLVMNMTADENEWKRNGFYPIYTDFSKGLDSEAYKITVEIFDDDAAEIIMSDFPAIDTVKFTGEPWVRFAEKAANKFEGVKALAAYIGIDMKTVIAFGDDYNDVGMLRECGIGVAVNNAIDEAKAAADFICDTNDNNGVAKWLEENFLSEYIQTE